MASRRSRRCRPGRRGSGAASRPFPAPWAAATISAWVREASRTGLVTVSSSPPRRGRRPEAERKMVEGEVAPSPLGLFWLRPGSAWRRRTAVTSEGRMSASRLPVQAPSSRMGWSSPTPVVGRGATTDGASGVCPTHSRNSPRGPGRGPGAERGLRCPPIPLGPSQPPGRRLGAGVEGDRVRRTVVPRGTPTSPLRVAGGCRPPAPGGWTTSFEPSDLPRAVVIPLPSTIIPLRSGENEATLQRFRSQECRDSEFRP